MLACIYRCLVVFKAPCAAIAPAVERTLGKGEVACSNHAGSTIFPVSYQTKANNRRDGLEGYWLSLRLVNIGASTQPM